jgi:hypothetical protein
MVAAHPRDVENEKFIVACRRYCHGGSVLDRRYPRQVSTLILDTPYPYVKPAAARIISAP